ncbi:MAG TPA: polysaccharide deacetylase family protein [Chthoniobacteraceae bacterium]|nr:polysaccharide deacetylase family protein [Chthoniobacteraceae bacterium]
MNSPRLFFSLLGLALSAGLLAAGAADAPSTQVLKWKDGKKAVFILSFDDSCQSQLNNVVPELNKRKLTGTFYLVMGGGVHAGRKQDWEAAVKSPYIVEANHTFTHKGVKGEKSVEDLDAELAKNNELLYALHPERKVPRLLAWGRPGGVPWEVTEEQELAELAKNHLLRRPSFFGPPIHYKTADECVAAIDKALAKGDMGHLDMHGVGGDWLVTPLDWFSAILDKLEANRDTIWSADALSYMEYKAERETAEVKELERTPARLRLSLTSKMDPALYDQPLTLTTSVPAGKKSWVVIQGGKRTTVEARDGVLQFEAVPGAGEITVE